MSAATFHALNITRVQSLCDDAQAFTFCVPADLRQQFQFEPGQFLTLRADVAGADVRRSYSICSSAQHFAQTGEVSVGIKRVAGGVFSNWANDALRPGSSVQVMVPQGRFGVKPLAGAHRLCIAAGSGITPMLSIMQSVLHSDDAARFTLILGNRRTASIMALDALQDLKDRFATRLNIAHVLSRQPQELPLFHGRLDTDKLSALIDAVVPLAHVSEALLCGPEDMMDCAQAVLLQKGLKAEQIHSERFLSNAPKNIATKPINVLGYASKSLEKAASVHITLDGKLHQVPLAEGALILDAALDAGLDLPYSCKGGVCCTCRCKVTLGQVSMDKCFTLEPDEIEAGYVLSCQARAITPEVGLSFDAR
jgi:ring-1,2-phenylacetyl-CoA epoxidase subunit PaaE